MRAWIILVGSAVFETVWAIALSESNGFSEPVPTVVFVVAAVISMTGLGIAAQHIPIGTAYGVWTGIGAVGTVVYSAVTGQEHLSWFGWLCLVVIVGAVVGLKLTTPGKAEGAPVSDEAGTL
ncbi:DMT family transporter [Agrococcus casei]|uniref:DMT family transporter n=1 Tax=Agrococcus casei TaxID=343512 RepID=UPI003F9071F3